MNRRHAAFVVAFLGGCDPDAKQAREDLARLEADMQGYVSWGQHADWTGIVESTDGTHGSHVQIWFDDAFLGALAEGGGAAMPEGAVAVKQGYHDAAGDDLGKLLAHQRQSDGHLFYAVWDDGELENYGRPDACTDCHALGQDEVMAVTW